MQTALVHHLNTNLAIMECCNSSDCNLTSGTPLGLSDVVNVMTNKCINKAMQCSNWTIHNDLSQETKDHGAFNTYVIWSIRQLMDQRLRVLEVPCFLVQLSTPIVIFAIS